MVSPKPQQRTGVRHFIVMPPVSDVVTAAHWCPPAPTCSASSSTSPASPPGYFGECFGRPFTEPIPGLADDAEPNADMWAIAEESREQIVDLYHRAWAHADATIDALPLDTVGVVPWWPPERREPTLHRVLIHMIAETERHAGHADIVRELIDGSAGIRADNSNLPDRDAAWWRTYHARVEQVAKDAASHQ